MMDDPQAPPPGPPAEVQALLAALASGLPALLGANFVGLYLHGSLTQAAFVPATSDVDCLLVTARALDAGQFGALAAFLDDLKDGNPWAMALQLTCLVRDQVLVMDAPACLYQEGVLRRTGSDGNPIIWRNTLDSGRTLAGEAPETFLPPITPALFDAALRRELGYLREELADPASPWRDQPKYRAYAVLTVCRILYSAATGRVGSKPEAAAWARATLPAEWRALIERAEGFRRKGGGAAIGRDEIGRFLALAEGRLGVIG